MNMKISKKGTIQVALVVALLAVAVGFVVYSVGIEAPPPVKECRDGIDNDGDGHTDTRICWRFGVCGCS